MKKIIILLAIIVIAAACNINKKKSADNPLGDASLFETLPAAQTGISFVNTLQETDSLSIMQYLYFYNGGGVSAGDINNDGLTDLYFVSNQGKNHLYLNKGGFKFEDITDKAGVGGLADWQTGVTMADVNGDGLLDIYVCAVSNYRGLKGHNELYINNGNLTFSEKSKEYGVDFQGFSTQATFFDYDKDGDLDIYLLNHAVHSKGTYDRVSLRGLMNDKIAGDILYKNEGGKFKDVSLASGIYKAPMGYGLGVTVADLNNDGWEDIYVGNDFHEDDYYYINNHNGTFSEKMREAFTHTSKFSMGTDIADFNNDGFLDVVSMDMYPEDPTVEKASAGEDPLEMYLYKLQFGYYPQYSRNALQLNQQGKKFSEIGALAGISATDWSWSPLFADFDLDGVKDLFVSNGIVKRPNDMDYINYVSSDIAFAHNTEEILKSVQRQREINDKIAISKMPDGKYHNYIFRGKKDLTFEDKSLTWGFTEANYANGAVYADLDNDGDLDLVTNNLFSPASIYQNKINDILKPNYLKIKLLGEGKNAFGLGAKVIIKTKNGWQIQQETLTRGFESSVEPGFTFGLGNLPQADTLWVIWNDGKAAMKTNVKSNQTVLLKQNEAQQGLTLPDFAPQKPLFKDISDSLSITYKHQENPYFDFTRESLIPFKVSTEGPKMAVGDVNGDGLEDFYVGGAKFQKNRGLFIQQKNGSFLPGNQNAFQADSLSEDVGAVFFDADNDKDLDLYVVSGGNEFFDKDDPLLDRLYLNDGKGNFTKAINALPPMYTNKSCVVPGDFDHDGDIDLFVGGHVISYHYGESPDSYLLINDGRGHFTDQTDKLAPQLRKIGMVTSGSWADIDGDKDLDLIVIGEWMPITIFKNDNGKLTPASKIDHSNGLWSSLASGDFDHDGDIDFVVGNLGTNTKFRRKEDAVLKMYVGDIDKNGNIDQVLAYQYKDDFYPVASKMELGKQMPMLNKRFTSYKDFAGKPIGRIFKSIELDACQLLEVNRFESVYLENLGNGEFKMSYLPQEAQFSKLYALKVLDFDGDGKLDILGGGNFYSVSTYQGRYDASYGLVLKGDGKGHFQNLSPVGSGFVLTGEIRDIKQVGNKILATRNNDKLLIFKKLK